jgi:ribonuclease HI
MTRQVQELKKYKNQDLIKELNDMMIRIKRHLFGIPGDTLKPENEELDSLTNKIITVLKQDNEPLIKH